MRRSHVDGPAGLSAHCGGASHRKVSVALAIQPLLWSFLGEGVCWGPEHTRRARFAETPTPQGTHEWSAPIPRFMRGIQNVTARPEARGDAAHWERIMMTALALLFFAGAVLGLLLALGTAFGE